MMGLLLSQVTALVEKVSSYFIAHADLELPRFVPQFPKCWDYNCNPVHACAPSCALNELGRGHFWRQGLM